MYHFYFKVFAKCCLPVNIMDTKYILPPIVSIVLNTVIISATFDHKISWFILTQPAPRQNLNTTIFLYLVAANLNLLIGFRTLSRCQNLDNLSEAIEVFDFNRLS